MKSKNLNDWLIALIVVACSVVLFIALAMALSGTMLGKPTHVLHVNFHDAIGINPGAQVKYAGAPAGKVAGIRILTREERIASGNPLNAVQVVLALNADVPPLPSDVKVSIAADTLLSDKLVVIDAGSPESPLLAPDTVLQGITPTTFDKLVRNIDDTLGSLKELLGGTTGKTGDLFDRVGVLLTDTQSLITGAKPVVSDAGLLMTDARQLITDNKDGISRTIVRLDKASGDLAQLATRANALIVNNGKKLTSSIADAQIMVENFKVTSAYTKILARNLTLRPSQLIWGGKPPPLPSEQEILRATRAIPAN
jgi:ABC-type transporter Mla subunit MlaD